jgi:7-cyano-7-deazaguanine synthase
MSNKKQNVVVSLSGGLDSSTLLLRALSEYDNVVCISFDYGQKHKVELERAQSLVDYLNNNPVRRYPHDHGPDGFGEIYPKVKYQVIKLNGLTNLLHSALVSGGDEVPEGHYEQENMTATVVPNRNKIFSSIVQAVALSITQKTGETCDIALGIHAGDHAIYPDCRQEFRDLDHQAFVSGNWGAEKVNFFTPYLEGNKFTILQDGETLCKELGLDFDEVYKRTNTSYKPIKWYTRPETNAYEWYSDYKSASSVERVEAFIKLGKPDPAKYADETGPVSWEIVKEAVEKVLLDYSK